MLRGLILSLLLFFLLQGCGERISSLKIIGSDFLPDSSNFVLDENYNYIKLQVNSNDFSYLALGYTDSDAQWGFNLCLV